MKFPLDNEIERGKEARGAPVAEAASALFCDSLSLICGGLSVPAESRTNQTLLTAFNLENATTTQEKGQIHFFGFAKSQSSFLFKPKGEEFVEKDLHFI